MEWHKARGSWLSVFNIPGGDNNIVGSLSRQTNEDMEGPLDIDAFQLIQLKLGTINIDLFASEQNHKLSQYVSFPPDFNAFAVIAFSIAWTNLNVFLVLPFSLTSES